MRTYYWREIVAAATKYGLDPVLVEAIAVTESAGNTDAFRFEKDFWNRLMKGKSEFKGLNPRRHSSSYGLLQPMWVVAVERGFPRDLPPELLFVPETNLDYGCRHLKFLFDWAVSGWPESSEQDRLEAVLSSYNGGRGSNKPTDKPKRNASYTRKVLTNYALLTQEHVGS
jgi:soluble lytic murein transglycosylase-like protein